MEAAVHVVIDVAGVFDGITAVGTSPPVLQTQADAGLHDQQWDILRQPNIHDSAGTLFMRQKGHTSQHGHHTGTPRMEMSRM